MKHLHLFLSLILLAFCGNIAAQGTGTADDPIVAGNLAQVKSGAEGTWYLVDLSGMKVSFKLNNELCLEDATAGLIFTKGTMKNHVSMGDNITSGKIKLACVKHGKSMWVDGSKSDIVVVEDIVKEAGTSVAKEVTLDEFTAENWGRYIKVKGKVVSADNGKGGYNYFINEAGVSTNRIMTNYCGSTIPEVADNDKEYYIHGILLSDFFRGSSFEEVTSSGVSVITVGKVANGNVYSINGTLVRKNAGTLDGLGKGIYVVDGKKVVVK